jgi:hypothetical protein
MNAMTIQWPINGPLFSIHRLREGGSEMDFSGSITIDQCFIAKRAVLMKLDRDSYKDGKNHISLNRYRHAHRAGFSRRL